MTGQDLATDIRRLIDAGYEIGFLQPLAGSYYVEVTGAYGSRWKCLGDTPAEALRANWPLGFGNGQGGCGHCDGLGCGADGCRVCAAYTSTPGNGVCGVCGHGYPVADEDELPGESENDCGHPDCFAAGGCQYEPGPAPGKGRDDPAWEEP